MVKEYIACLLLVLYGCSGMCVHKKQKVSEMLLLDFDQPLTVNVIGRAHRMVSQILAQLRFVATRPEQLSVDIPTLKKQWINMLFDVDRLIDKIQAQLQDYVDADDSANLLDLLVLLDRQLALFAMRNGVSHEDCMGVILERLINRLQ